MTKPPRASLSVQEPVEISQSRRRAQSVSDGNVFVVSRFRPYIAEEQRMFEGREALKELSVEYLDQKVSIHRSGYQSSFEATLDKIYGPNTSQTQFFDDYPKQIVDFVLSGYHGTIFAFGQTGSGKTHTLFGPDMDVECGDERGVIPRALEQIFEFIDDDLYNEWKLTASFHEIYCERIIDLLQTSRAGNKNLRIREDPRRGIYVDGLSLHSVRSINDVMMLIRQGARARSVSSTNMNETSSRSHSVFTLKCTCNHEDGQTNSTLHLVDLAGSECVKKTGATGNTFNEAIKINQSLSALGRVINQLSSRQDYVSFRESKLTFLLKNSLTLGKLLVIVTASEHPGNLDETISTLRFAMRAKNVVTTAKINKELSTEQLKAIIRKLKCEVSELESKNAKLIDYIRSKYEEDFDPESIGSTGTRKTVRRGSELSITESDAEQANLFDVQLSEHINIYTERLESQERMMADLSFQLSETREKNVMLQQEVKELHCEVDLLESENRTQALQLEYHSDSKTQAVVAQCLDAYITRVEQILCEAIPVTPTKSNQEPSSFLTPSTYDMMAKDIFSPETLQNPGNALQVVEVSEMRRLEQEVQHKNHIILGKDVTIGSLKRMNEELMDQITLYKETVTESLHKRESLANSLFNKDIEIENLTNELDDVRAVSGLRSDAVLRPIVGRVHRRLGVNDRNFKTSSFCTFISVVCDAVVKNKKKFIVKDRYILLSFDGSVYMFENIDTFEPSKRYELTLTSFTCDKTTLELTLDDDVYVFSTIDKLEFFEFKILEIYEEMRILNRKKLSSSSSGTRLRTSSISLSKVVSSRSPSPSVESESVQYHAIHNFSNSQLSGYLQKLSSSMNFLKNWRKRWFTLKDGCLHYFENKHDFSPKGTISLATCCIDEFCSDIVVDKEHTFCLWFFEYSTRDPNVLTMQRKPQPFVMAAAGLEQKARWIEAIQSVIEQVQLPFDVQS
ncbi:hypothetical protein PCE1_001557 [Barthelona sp. PCE]